MRRTDLSYYDGARLRSFNTAELQAACLLVAQLPTRVLVGIKTAGPQQDPRVNPQPVVEAAAQEWQRRERSETEFERALAAGTSSKLRRRSFGFTL